MTTKKKTNRPAKSEAPETIFSEVKESDMSSIDRKIHDLLIAEGYYTADTQKLEGMKLNNYTDINRIEYRRGERERIIISTHEPAHKKTA